MVYHNMRFWRQVFTQAPLLAQQFKDMLEQSIQASHDLYGPMTIFQRDLDWLGCRFSPEADAISNSDNDCILFTEPDQKKFEHFIREQIRRRFFQQLEQKHSRWTGVVDADLQATTKLLRSLEPSSPYRNPLIRTLSDAHATPYRLFQIGIKATPHCPYCLHEKGCIQHIMWDCPRFAEIRRSWPQELIDRNQWPECSKSALICSYLLSESTRSKWHQLQLLVAQLLFQWMEMNRNPENYQQFVPEEIAQNQVGRDVLPQLSRQSDELCSARALPLQWNPPGTRTAWNRWGSSIKDFALIFSFWTKWTDQRCANAVRIRTWTQALALFVQYGGIDADFLGQCQFIGMAAYKLRILTAFLFQTQQQNQELQSMTFSNDAQTKWLEAFPNETAFPDGLFFIPKWDLLDASNNIQRIRLEARMASNVNSQVLRVSTAAFCEAVGMKAKILMSSPLSENWPIPRFSRKGGPIPWIQQVRLIKDDIKNNRVTEQIQCITQIALERWTAMSSDEIRSALPTKPGPIKRFRAAKNRITKFKEVLERFKQNMILENDFHTHVLEPIWAPTETCACCKKILKFSVEPRNITRRCPNTIHFPVQMLDNWSLKYDSMLRDIDSILSKLS